MPAIYTHTVFARNVLKKLPSNIKKSIKSETKLYELFSQSFDFLFYYNFLSIKSGSYIRNFGRFCHRNNSKAYLLNIIKYLKDNNLTHNKELLAYLYGSINHYTCDSTMHPYINYLAKEKNKKGMHTKIEFNIDAYYYEKETHKCFYKYNLAKDLLSPIHFSNTLKSCMDTAYKTTFNVDNIGKIYEKSYNQSHILFKLAMQDRLGIKKAIYKIIDLIPFKFDFSFSACSFNIKQIDTSFLNIDHNAWNNICYKDTKYTYSWDDLFKKAELKSIKIINLCDLYFKDKITFSKLSRSILNITYSNGIKLDSRHLKMYKEL